MVCWVLTQHSPPPYVDGLTGSVMGRDSVYEPTLCNTRCLHMGLFQSIRPEIKYQSGKANIVTNALSKSQHSSTEDSLEDAEAKASQWIYAMIRITTKPMPED